jgi:hypothetical protein
MIKVAIWLTRRLFGQGKSGSKGRGGRDIHSFDVPFRYSILQKAMIDKPACLPACLSVYQRACVSPAKNLQKACKEPVNEPAMSLPTKNASQRDSQ